MAFIIMPPPESPRRRSNEFKGLWWGLALGLVSGSILGAYMMSASSVATLPVAITPVSQGLGLERVEEPPAP